MKLKKALGAFLIFAIFFSIGFLFSNKEANSVAYVTDTQKQIIRDTKRLSDITKLKNAIESYKTTNGYYPKLTTGTYIKGYVNSSWVNSWTSFCGLIGLTSDCPKDPVNEIANCNCNLFGSSCNINDLDINECYNAKLQKFVCTKGSYIYQYQVLNNGKNYSLNMDFEYTQGYGYGNYFNTNINEGNNIIDIDDNCVAENTEYKILSGANAVCGNKLIEAGEFCDGNSKIEFCTNPSGVRGRISVPCTGACVFQNVNLNGNVNCNTKGFCGDSIIQQENGEDCDNNSEELCFLNVGQNSWYNEQIRYCKDNCKFNRDSTTGINAQTCGGYCGDGIVQPQEECDYSIEYLKWNGISFKQCSNYRESGLCSSAGCLWKDGLCVEKKCINYDTNITCIADSDCEFINNTCLPKSTALYKNHCGIRGNVPCKYENNPAIFSSSFSLDTRSYIKQNNSFQYSGFVKSDKTSGKVDVTKNSLFFDVRVSGIKDLDGDSIRYKFDFTRTSNNNIGFFKADKNTGDLQDVANKPDEITGEWVSLDLDSYGYGFVRIYSTSTESNAENIKLIDGTYFGDYSFNVSIKDTWNQGSNIAGNQQGAITSQAFNFYIGSTCGDFTLQSVNDDGQHEYCEYKSSGARFTNFAEGEPSVMYDGQPQSCVALKTGTGWSGKWDDIGCSDFGYGICKKNYSAGCGSGWTSYGSSFCYTIPNIKGNWDTIKQSCVNSGGDLFIIRNVAENNFINSLFQSNATLSGQSFVWLGYYNINKIRDNDRQLDHVQILIGGYGYTVDKTSMIVSVEENGNSRLNNNNIYDGGAIGEKYSSQYLCSKSCTDIGGYCMDGVLENGLQIFTPSESSLFGLAYNKEPKKYYYYVSNFEQCDPSTNAGKIQTGSGTSGSDEYGCINCMFDAGYCGDQSINHDGDNSANDNQDFGYGDGNDIDFEHCDPTHKLIPIESGNIQFKRGYNVDGYGANYVCWEDSSIPSTSENFGLSTTKAPWIAYKQDGTTQIGTLAYFMAHRDEAKIFLPNSNGVCQKSSGGYCGDGVIQVSYNQMTKNERELKLYAYPVYNSVNRYIKNDATYGKNSWFFSYGYGYGEDPINNLSKLFTGSMKLEECDPNYFVFPEESNSLTSGVFYTIDGGASVVFNGKDKLKYYCHTENTNKCTFQNNFNILDGEKAAISESGRAYSFCGDGIISSYGYGSEFIKTTNGITNLNTTNREECDPKDRIVGLNGTGYGNTTLAGHTDKWFGCKKPGDTGTYVYGVDCSSYITPTTSSATNTYSCSYGCKYVTNTTYGYCGDGQLQSNFLEECDFGGAGYNSYGQVTLFNGAFTSTSNTQNYLCGKSLNNFGGYFDSEFYYGYNGASISSVSGMSVFSSGVMQNNLLGCKQLGGYLGDGRLQACLRDGNGYGYNNWNKCYEYVSGTNSYGLISGAKQIEICEPLDSRGYEKASNVFGYGCNSSGTGCNPGYYLVGGVCKACDLGYYCEGGTKNKEACNYGKYTALTNATGTVSGAYSAIEKVIITNGAYNTTWDGYGAKYCVTCPKDTFTSTIKNITCDYCPSYVTTACDVNDMNCDRDSYVYVDATSQSCSACTYSAWSGKVCTDSQKYSYNKSSSTTVPSATNNTGRCPNITKIFTDQPCKYCPTAGTVYGGYFVNSSAGAACYNNTYNIEDSDCCAGGVSYPNCPSGFTRTTSTDHHGGCCFMWVGCDHGISTCSFKYYCDSLLNCPTVAGCPVGKYMDNLSSCQLCPIGTYQNIADFSGGSCMDCDPGTYQASTGQSSCTLCTGNTYNLSTGSTSASACKVCPSNATCPNGSARPDCNDGNYISISGATATCETCVSGNYCADNSSYVCPSGSYCPAGADRPRCASGYGQYNTTDGINWTNTCTTCPAGSYCPVGAETPTICPVGSYCPTGSTSPTVCGAGNVTNTLASTGASTCTACSAGTYDGDSNSTTACSPCAAGTYTASTGATSCTACSAGNVTNTLASTGATSCTACGAGTYDNDSTSTTACSNCGAGYYCAGGTARAACAAGTYTASTTASSCSPCSAGYVTNTLASTGATTCTICAPGTYDNDSNSTTACSNCGAGHYCTGGIARNSCSAGTYTSSATASSCSACGAGNVTDTLASVGATTCTTCAAGTYDGDSNSTTACSNCGAGYYCTGGTARAACAAGTYTSSANTTSAASCNPCTNTIEGGGGVFLPGQTSSSCAVSCSGACQYNGTNACCEIAVPTNCGEGFCI